MEKKILQSHFNRSNIVEALLSELSNIQLFSFINKSELCQIYYFQLFYTKISVLFYKLIIQTAYTLSEC